MPTAPQAATIAIMTPEPPPPPPSPPSDDAASGAPAAGGEDDVAGGGGGGSGGGGGVGSGRIRVSHFGEPATAVSGTLRSEEKAAASSPKLERSGPRVE